MFNYLGPAGGLCIDVKTSGQSPQVSCVSVYFLMKSARLPTNNQISSKQVLKLSRPIAQTAIPPKWHLEKHLIHCICGQCFAHRVDSGVMKPQADSLNVFIQSITQNVMPR